MTDIKCRCCDSSNLELVLDLGLQPWGNHFVPIKDAVEVPRFPLELFFCKDCFMVQIGYTVPKEFMFVEHKYLSGTTRSLREHFDNVCKNILTRKRFLDGDYVLDVGGNDGTFLNCFKSKDVKVLNIDSGIKQAQISNESRIPCINKFFNEESAVEILRERGPAKIIHGSGIFFHLEELHSVFSGIGKLLDPQGMLVAEFIYLPKMIKNNAFDQIYHEHLLYYTIKSFDRLLNQHGLTIYDAELSPIHGGSCIAYIGRPESVEKTQELNDLIKKEEDEGYDRIQVYKEFAERVSTLKERLVGIIRDLKREGKRIQALGAPVKGTTIINYCGLDSGEIDCAVEINELKCNTYIPGTRIPVFHQDRTPPPDLYLLLAWNFKEEVLEKLAGFRRNGGKVLVPIPNPEII